MLEATSFRVELTPRGQGRARIGRVGAYARMFKAAADAEHESAFAEQARAHRPAVPFAGAVLVSIIAVLPRPQSLTAVSKRTGQPLADPKRRWHTARPDADNIAKGVLDAMRDWWTDDCVVAGLNVSKFVAGFGEQPHYHVSVVPLQQPQQVQP